MRGRVRLSARTARIPTSAPFMLTSMMDMFTIILVFLLNLLDPANESDPELVLPSAKIEQAVEAGVVLTVTTDRVSVDGVEVLRLADGALLADTARTGRSVNALHARLVEAGKTMQVSGKQAQQDAANPVLSVQCDRAVPFSVLGELLYTAGQAGFGQFRFVVINDSG
ncbi:MAG: biopolymer transporter ExbD [Pseudomonadota bacterium]|nr:biopolymer transporter ExbD [Pseudomonadota bacterium]